MSGHRLAVTTPTDDRIVLTRSFTAPRALVFAALTTPDLLRRWLGADGWHLVEADVDLRVGGAWRFVSRGPGGERMGHHGVYRVVDPPGRLAYTEEFDDRWVPGEALVDAVLTEDAGVTTLTTTVTYPSREARDVAVRSTMERGLGEGYRRLDAFLAEAQAGTETETQIGPETGTDDDGGRGEQ